MNGERYHEVGAAICRPYVQAFDPDTDVSAYLSEESGMIAHLEPEATTCWDYSDDSMMPPASGRP